ncbi:MAG: hypothetical protein JWQ03_3105 [Variovorax sp.]|nr:hypothetical protein [Variovorax sp.]
MTEAGAIHVASVMAVWMIFLSSIRFGLAGAYGLKPVALCLWRLVRCKDTDKRACWRRLVRSMDEQFLELMIALTTKWSAVLLFGGMGSIGFGMAFGSAGDVAQLVADRPTLLNIYDRGMDCICALLVCFGMAAVLAALSKRRTMSSAISLGFMITGLGVGLVTAAHP